MSLLAEENESPHSRGCTHRIENAAIGRCTSSRCSRAASGEDDIVRFETSTAQRHEAMTKLTCSRPTTFAAAFPELMRTGLPIGCSYAGFVQAAPPSPWRDIRATSQTLAAR